jgi:4-amino-4-deoxy-L-arabinose transferase-like glycosyltransferase
MGEQAPRLDWRAALMGAPKQKPLVLFLIEAYLVSLGSRLPGLLFPPCGFVYNADEQIMAFQSLDRFLGLPAAHLAWPGTTVSLLSLPLFLADFLLSSHFPTSFTQAISLFAAYLSRAYADPRHMILLVRWTVALISSAGVILFYYIAAELSKSRLMGLACALLLAFQPSFYQHSVMATGDAVSLTLALAAVLCLLRRSSPRSATLAGFLFSGAMAAKITISSFIVLPLLLILLPESPAGVRQRMQVLFRFCGSLVVGFMLWCPYVWTDPTRLGKSALGNATYPATRDFHAFLSLWNEAMGITFTVLALLALGLAIALISERREIRIVAAALAAEAAILAPLFLHTTRAFSRYFLPVTPCILILLAAGMRLFDSERPLLRRWRAPALGLAALACLTVCAETYARELSLRGPDELATAVKLTRTLPEQTTLFLPEAALLTYEVPLSQPACDQMVERARQNLQDEDAVIRFVGIHGVPSSSAKVFLWSLNENEQCAYRRLAAACLQASGSRAISFYYAPFDSEGNPQDVNAKRTSLATMDLDAAIEAMQRTGDAAILAPFAVASLGKPLWSGERWHWYKRP